MMKIALYGATGHVGQRILTEALQRGHEVTAIVRDPARLTVSHENLRVITGDAMDSASVATSVVGQDVVIGSISGRRDGDPDAIPNSVRALVAGIEKAGVRRLLWVGGASSLEVAPGVRLFDTPEFPEIYKAEARAGIEALEILRALPEGIDWTFLSPAAEIMPGERTGKFRIGGDQLLTDAQGKSHISFEDYAVALVDEIENHQHPRQRFSVAY